MKLEQAKAECERWFAHMQREEDKSIALQKLASDRRMGRCSAEEGKRRRGIIMGPSPAVYDGANLADAVKTLLKYV